MKAIRVYIVEDEPLIAATIESALLKEGFSVAGMADNVGDAFFEIDDIQPDLVFIDITLDKGPDGIQLGGKLRDKTNIPFIYLTSHSDKATVAEASATNPSGYLLKPFKSKNLKVAIDFALSKAEVITKESSIDYIFIKRSKKWSKLDVSDILFAKADDTYTEIHTASDRYVISQSLKKINEKLPHNKFQRVHRTFVVNINAISDIEDDLLKVGNTLIPIGKTYKKELLSRLNFL